VTDLTKLPGLQPEVRPLPPEVNLLPGWVQGSLKSQLDRIGEAKSGLVIDVAVNAIEGEPGKKIVQSMVVYKINEKASFGGWISGSKVKDVSYGATIVATF